MPSKFRKCIIRMDAPLFFANCATFKKFVLDTVSGKFSSQKAPLEFIILDVTSMIDIDLTGLRVLNEIHEELVHIHVQLSFAGTKGPIKDRLSAANFIQKLGERFMYSSIDDAISDNAMKYRRASILEEIDLVTNRDEARTAAAQYNERHLTLEPYNLVPFSEDSYSTTKSFH